MELKREVKGEGPLTARIVVVGEAGGDKEQATGRPFAGVSGWVLDKWLQQAGLSRRDLRVDNVVQRRPFNNKLENLEEGELELWKEDLKIRMSALSDPWVIVPVGGLALEAVCSLSGITKWRGSILSTSIVQGREVKVIPCLHPSFIMRQPDTRKADDDIQLELNPSWERASISDWKRISVDATFRDLRLPVREHIIQPTLSDVQWFVNEAKKKAEAMAIDIETPGGRVGCVGFSFDPAWSFTIPTTIDYWENPSTLSLVWDMVRTLCELSCEKILQNGLFDTYYLWMDHGIKLTNWRWDTLCQSHCLIAPDRHSLAYQGSRYTRQPYWKEMRKDSEDTWEKVKDFPTHWRYNGIDACVTRELGEIHYSRLVDAGLLDFYDRHYADLFEPCFEMMVHGLPMDRAKMEVKSAELLTRCDAIKAELEEIAGYPLHAKKDLSSDKIKKFLQTDLGLALRKDRKTGKPTANKFAMKALRYKVAKVREEEGNERKLRAIDLISEHRRKFKLSGFFNTKVLDDDDRVRSQLGYLTDSGRMNSKKNPKGKGMNVFNIDREARDVFVARPGHILLELDASQMESRIVNLLTHDPEMIKLARTHPTEYDDHCFNASAIFEIPYDELIAMRKLPKEDPQRHRAEEMRYLGKRSKHGFNYDMSHVKLSELLLLEGFDYSPAECKRFIDALDRAFPAVRGVYHKDTRKLIMRDHKLVNSWGRELSFEYLRLTGDTYRQGYAFRPQSDGADMVKTAMRKVWVEIKERGWDAALLVSVYDSLLFSVAPAVAYDLLVYAKGALEAPHTYYGHELSIPAEAAIGLNWGDKKEFKVLPTREVFEADVDKLLGREAKDGGSMPVLRSKHRRQRVRAGS